MLRIETEAEQAFRREVRDWYEAELPEDLRDLTFRPEPAQALGWYRRLSQKGWIAPHWPKAFGGMGASPVEQVILMEEAARIGAPELPTQGLNQIGPILQRFGTPEQQARHLPAILNGDVIWCQGYSEPGAGSDLASLRTRGRVEGDEIVITGHKIWTTWGHHADWIYALVRTNEELPRRQGITFILIDLKSPGITRRPIRTLADECEFCEVFFDAVRVPRANVVGILDGGWNIVTALLDEERIQLGAPSHALRALERVRRMARALGPVLGVLGRLRLAEAETEVAALTAAFLQTPTEAEQGRTPDASSLKILSTETTQRVLDIAQELAGAAAPLKSPASVGGTVIDFSELFLQSRRLSIYGGTNEIQRGLIADRVLKLPKGKRP
ncbi:acyl-CoA dehydrogenase family protein [Xanthobacter autotrophicus]|uniref:acyl-CoA dehydrogenase family protein n=1 Tax=Xanthobacter autotrophicus TaxID=280 RepID=UPI001E5A5F77|nr:acyl-CoA dehydrogenase family protein [Xanthobacter autotrophicus]UDQ87724.1 acyl-CoA dehydrogenase family protein [Xanthobacter autotrophicus]